MQHARQDDVVGEPRLPGDLRGRVHLRVGAADDAGLLLERVTFSARVDSRPLSSIRSVRGGRFAAGARTFSNRSFPHGFSP